MRASLRKTSRRGADFSTRGRDSLGNFQILPLANAGKADVDHLHRLIRRVVGVAVLVERVERFADFFAGPRAPAVRVTPEQIT